jgi:putative tryptophan/tyrosine transport system substrate-binding protein
MRRREFIFALGGALVSPPLAAHAEKTTIPVIGYLGSASPEPNRLYTAAFIRGLTETGLPLHWTRRPTLARCSLPVAR